MNLVIETGAGVASANSYCSPGAASLYVDAIGALDEWFEVVEARAEDGLLVAATRMLEARYPWVALPLSASQGLGLPRANALILTTSPSTPCLELEDGRILTGEAQVALAAEAAARLALMLWRQRTPADGAIVTSESLGSWAVRYGRAEPEGFEVVDAILAPMWAPRVPAGYAVA
jgi:hypothetical protein